jgi:hypothetical protein
MSIFSSKKTKWTLFSLLMALVLVGGGLFGWVLTTTAAVNKQVNTDTFGLAIQGYDTVAYHTQNDANRDLFAENPERYAPQYGGY